MGKDWTKEELEQASGQMGHEEFCEMLIDRKFEIESSKQTDATIEK